MSDRDLSPDDRVLAAELALGVLEGRSHAAAQARYDSDPVFREAVVEVAARLAPLAEDIAPQTPSRDLLPGILAAIRQAPQDAAPEAPRDRATAWPANGLARHGPARPSPPNGGETASDDGTIIPFRRRALVRFGPLISALAAALVIVAVLLWPGAESGPTLVAELAGDAKIGVEWHDNKAIFVLSVPASAVPEGQVAELWAIPEGGAPVSLGVREPDGGAVRPSDQRRALIGDGLTLAVSLEPPGGSPESGPTGPVIASGVLRPSRQG